MPYSKRSRLIHEPVLTLPQPLILTPARTFTPNSNTEVKGNNLYTLIVGSGLAT